MIYKAILLFGAPGSGKGTQGKILGAIPGFYHSACGDVFRSLDLQSEISDTDLDDLQRLSSAHAVAAQALRGLVHTMLRRRGKVEEAVTGSGTAPEE